MTITSSLRFLYIFWGSGLLCAVAAVFYSTKFKQNRGLAGLTSRGGPDIHIRAAIHSDSNIN